MSATVKAAVAAISPRGLQLRRLHFAWPPLSFCGRKQTARPRPRYRNFPPTRCPPRSSTEIQTPAEEGEIKIYVVQTNGKIKPCFTERSCFRFADPMLVDMGPRLLIMLFVMAAAEEDDAICQ